MCRESEAKHCVHRQDALWATPRLNRWHLLWAEGTKLFSFERLSPEKEVLLWHSAHTGLPRKSWSQGVLIVISNQTLRGHWRHSPGDLPTVWANWRPWHCPCDAVLIGGWKVRILLSWKQKGRWVSSRGGWERELGVKKTKIYYMSVWSWQRIK